MQGDIKITHIAHANQKRLQCLPGRCGFHARKKFEKSQDAFEATPSDSGLMQHFRVSRERKRIQVELELGKCLAQDALCGFSQSPLSFQLRWVGASGDFERID